MTDGATNVIVVGSGLAGIAATCELLEMGCKVTLIDKNPRATTGNSSKCSTGILAPLQAKQQAAGIKDDMAEIVVPPGDDFGQLMLKSGADVEWLLQAVKAAAEFSYSDALGHSTQRVLSNKLPHSSGQAICARAATIFDYLNASGKITLLRGETVTSLVTQPGRGVCGVMHCHTDDVDNPRSPKETVLGQVIICTGGSAGSEAVQREKQLPAVSDPRVDGSSIRLATDVGAQVTRLNEITLTPYGCAYPGEEINSFEEKFCLSGTLTGAGVTIINERGELLTDKTGRPFKNLHREERGAICDAMRTGSKIGSCRLLIGNVPQNAEKTLAFYANNKFVDVYSNLKECAKGLNLPEVEKHTHIAGRGNIYAVNITPACYAVCGGLKVDIDGSVQDDKNQVIPGLLAAGETAAGPSLKMYGLAGAPLLHCIVSGRAAAARAAKTVFQGKVAPKRMGMTDVVKSTHETASAKEQEADKGPEAAKEQELNLDAMSKDELIKLVQQKDAELKDRPAGAPAGPVDDTKYFTLDEVSKHKSKDDAWLVINDDVIDVTKFVANHPGGEQAIMAYAGNDASAEWNQIHKPGLVEAVGLKNGAKKIGRFGSPGAAAAVAPAGGAAPAKSDGISIEEVGKHSTKEDAWIVVNGDVLDVTKFIDNHPGGVPAIMGMVGKDATSDWNAIHRMGLVESVGLKSGAKLVGKFSGGSPAPAGGAAEPAFWDLPPPPDGEPAVFETDIELLDKIIKFLSRGWIGAVVHLLYNFAINIGSSFLNTGNFRFKSERMGTIRSGLFLVMFVIMHAGDNQATHLGRVQYNAMTYLLADRIQGEGTSGFAWFDMYIGMAVLLHVPVALKRSWEINMGYTIGSGRWKWLLSGLTILFFLIHHLMDFRFAANINPDSVKNIEAKLPPWFVRLDLSQKPFVFLCADDNDPNAYVVQTRDVYLLEEQIFSQPLKVLQYVSFVAAVGAHLWWAWPKIVTSDALYIPKGHQNRVKYIGWFMAVACCLLYVSIPISFFLGVMPSATGEGSDVCGGQSPMRPPSMKNFPWPFN